MLVEDNPHVFIRNHQITALSRVRGRISAEAVQTMLSREICYRRDKCSRLPTEKLASNIRYTLCEILIAVSKCFRFQGDQKEIARLLGELREMLTQWNESNR